MSKRHSRQKDSAQGTEAQVKTESESVNREAKEQADKPSVTIDGVAYTLESLGDQGREQLQNLRVTDQEIRRLQDQLAIMQTARNTYARILGDVVRTAAAQA